MKKPTSWSYRYFRPCNPQSFIAVKNNRIKHYEHEGENRLYLEDGTEFELEFYNDSNDYVKAEITINGVKESSALVLRPHQRFYLDRFMDEKKKFKFNTFLTGNDDIEKLKEIIEKNGRIKVEFYQEVNPLPITWMTTINEFDNLKWGSVTSNTTFYPDTFITNDGGQSGGFASVNSYGAKKLKSIDCYNSNTLDMDACSKEPKEIETGRIEAGKKSNQDFVSTNMQFNVWSIATFEYHIMPMSHKPKKVKMAKKKKDVIVADSVRTYCPGCGRKVKKGWNFCAGCGNRF